MKRTFEEKVNYNEANSKKSDFSAGYSLAVTLYNSYVKLPNEGKQTVQRLFDNARIGLRAGQEKLKTANSDMARYNAKQSIDYNKGMLCGMRDAANERKKRNS